MADDRKYEGDWLDEKRHGQGTLSNLDGSQNVGEWIDDELQGQFTFADKEGSTSVGQLVKGKKHGQGTMTWGPNSILKGDKYVGN